jgi:hypothetical protein
MESNNQPSNNPMELFLQHMLRHTVRLIRNAASIGSDSGVASGIIAQISRRLILLTAGHIFDRAGTWTLETATVVGGRTLNLHLPNVQRLCSIELRSGEESDIDLAWAPLDCEEIKEQMRRDAEMQGRAINLPIYTGPLDLIPDAREDYGFVAQNRVELHPAHRLYSQPSYEVGMAFRGYRETDGLYEFALAGPHKGHAYYSGASGAPIANREGKIVSLLLSGHPTGGAILWGVPLARYAPLLNLV